MAATTALPRMVITGASGFIGRHLLEVLKGSYSLIAIGRRSQVECGAPRHRNIQWYQVDIGDCRSLTALFHEIRDGGGAEILVHLAAHYDFTGDDDPEYWRTNVEGLRNVLDLSRGLGLRRFVFASSVAACSFPEPGEAITEASAPDGEHIYSETKRIGEQMLDEYRHDFPSTIVRFAALFSDWCEYPPLFVFLDTWLSSRWNARVLGGKGLSAVPYMHVRDAASFLRNLLERVDDAPHGAVFIASPDGSVNHAELFRAATAYYYGQARRPVLMPKPLCLPGMVTLDLLGRLLGSRPFERPWMARYIDLALDVDASLSRSLLRWEPRARLDVVRRVPFMLENFKTDPVEWYRRNREAMKKVELRGNLRIHRLLEAHEAEISRDFTAFVLSPEGRAHLRNYQFVAPEEHEWNHRLLLRNLMNAIRTREKGVFMAYCRDLAERRFKQGFRAEELSFAVGSLNEICLRVLHSDPDAAGLEQAIHDYVTMTIEFGVDQIQEVFEYLEAGRKEMPTSRMEDQLWAFRKGRRVGGGPLEH